MGNQSAKDEAEDGRRTGEMKSDSQHCQLEKRYMGIQLLREDHEARPGLSVLEYKRLFLHNEYFGELLYYKCMGESDTKLSTDSVMTKHQFVMCGANILQLANMQEQIDFYFTMFVAKKPSLSCQVFQEILNSCYRLELINMNINISGALQLKSTILKSMEKSLFSNADSVEKGDFLYWIGRHCPRLMYSIHPYVSSVLCSSHSSKEEAASINESLQSVLDGHYLMCFTVLWAINTYIPTSYKTAVDVREESMDLIQSSSLADIVGPGGWQMLYDSNTQGLSLNRFEHHVMSYAAATLTLVQFEGHLYCIGSDSEWVEKTERWGGHDCFLLQILPQYRVIQAGPSMVYLNIQDRKCPKGIFIGKDSRSTMLQIDTDFSQVKHYGIDVPLQRIEVWGCGKRSLHEAQLQQRKWENQEADRHKNRKLKIEDWKDNPDRQLLQMGGVVTEHAER